MFFNRTIIILLILILIFLQAHLWFGKNNVFDYFENGSVLIKLEHGNQQLKVRNDQMYEEIKNFRTGKEAVEERAINSMNMIYTNQVFFRLVEKEKH